MHGKGFIIGFITGSEVIKHFYAQISMKFIRIRKVKIHNCKHFNIYHVFKQKQSESLKAR